MKSLVSALCREHQLTLAEAEIAIEINLGHTLNEIAAKRGVSIHTVRNQVKSAIAKTESRRQADLSRIVEALRHQRVTDLLPGGEAS